MLRKPVLLSLCLIVTGLASGCGDDKKKVDATAAKEWAQKSPPPAYLERMKGMTGAPGAHPVAPPGGVAPAAPK